MFSIECKKQFGKCILCSNLVHKIKHFFKINYNMVMKPSYKSLKNHSNQNQTVDELLVV